MPSGQRWTKDLFIRAVTVDKHGCWFLPSNKTRTHSIAYKMYHGDIPKVQKKGNQTVSMCVCHKCDVPECCNPAHLFLGTFKDNNDDRAKKGRSYRPFGELNVMKRMDLKAARSGTGNPMYGRTHGNETRKKIGDAGRGELSASKRADVRFKLSVSGRAVSNVTCEYCGKELKPWTYARWHGENCNARTN